MFPHCGAVYLNVSTVQLSQQRSQSLWPAHTLHSLGLVMCVFVASNPRLWRARSREDWHKGDLDLWWHWSSGARPGRRFSLRGIWLQWKAEDRSSLFLFIYAARGGGASFTSSLDNCEQREFLYLPLTFQAADSAEIVSLGDDYPNKRSFKPLPAAEAVLHWLYYSLCVWYEMTLNTVAMILIPTLRYRGSYQAKIGNWRLESSCYNISTELVFENEANWFSFCLHYMAEFPFAWSQKS